jgi:hypothetical protein
MWLWKCLWGGTVSGLAWYYICGWRVIPNDRVDATWAACRIGVCWLFLQSTLLLTLRPSCSSPMPATTSWTRCLNWACTSSDS